MARYFNKQMAGVLLVYVRCPSTGKTIDGIPGDDKVMCNCPEAQSRGGTHLMSQCAASTVEQYMAERNLTEKKGGE
jgi:hypothetical protein